MLLRKVLFIFLVLISTTAYCQQDITFHLNAHLLSGKKILKVKRDFYDPFLWVLAQNNEVYRVNSLTQAIDDYTSKFSSYGNLQFVDIAGRSQDTVFIATNSPNVIHFKNGAIRLLGPADGIPDVANSVGMESREFIYNRKSPVSLMIATGKGLSLYDPDKETLTIYDPGTSKVFAACYRTEMFKDSSTRTQNFNTQDTIQFQPAQFWTGNSAQITYLWEGSKYFADGIATADNLPFDIYGNQVFSNVAWGNKRGLFINLSNYSYNPILGQAEHYLDGININKITDIYGLVAFGNPNTFGTNGLVRQNLLAGTDEGLYFSNSFYQNKNVLTNNFDFFHDDDLGNVRVNDICVNATAWLNPLCENGAWVATDNGLYFIQSDYGNLNAQVLQAINFENQPAKLSDLKVCAGETATALIDNQAYSGNNILWYKNGVQIQGAYQPSLDINSSGAYYATLFDPCSGYHIQSNSVTVEIINSPVFTFNYPDKIQQCNDTPLTLQTTANPGYTYRWYTNGVLNGNTTSSYNVTQTGKYKVEVSACTNSWVPSKEVEVDLVTLPVPQVTSDKTIYCAEDVAVLTENATVDPSYTINWYRDGNLLTAGNNLTNVSSG